MLLGAACFLGENCSLWQQNKTPSGFYFCDEVRYRKGGRTVVSVFFSDSRNVAYFSSSVTC